MITQTVVDEGDGFVLVRLSPSVTLPAPRAAARGSRPRRVVLEQGHYLASQGARAVTEFVELEQGRKLEDPDKRLLVGGVPTRWWRGGGLARDRVSAHIVVPGQPDLHRGKVVAYWLAPAGDPVHWRTATRGDVVIKVLDLLASRYSCGGRARPEPIVVSAVEGIAHRLELPLVGGYTAGAPASPGDALEALLRQHAGDDPLHHLPGEDDMQQHAEARGLLRELGFEPGDGTGWCASAYAALIAFQTMVQIVPDGVLGPITMGALRRSAPPR